MALVKWAKDKPPAYMELISQYPGYEITFVDDQPLFNLDKLMEIPEIRDRVNLILLNSPKASIQSPNRGSETKTWRLFSPIDSTDNIIKYCLIKHCSTPEDLEEVKKMLNDVDPKIIPLMDSDPDCRQFFCDLAYLKCHSTGGYQFVKMFLHNRLEIAHFDDWWDLVKPQKMEKPKEKAFKWLPFKHKQKSIYDEIKEE